MTQLRWILIICGAALLVGIYLWGRRGSKNSQSTSDGIVRARSEPPTVSSEPGRAIEAAVPDDLASDTYGDEPLDDIGVQAPAERIVVSPRSPPLPGHNADPSRTPVNRDVRRGRVEPTFSDSAFTGNRFDEVPDEEDEIALTAELPVREPVDAPTLSMSNSAPPSRRIERRKIVSLRLAASAQRFSGEQLREALEAQSLRHGRYDVFHRANNDNASVFSVASMVEPGTFDLDGMATQSYPGITLFAQLPGPIAGVHALHDLVECGKRLQEVLGGTLQDDRGVPLTVHRIDRLRQEVVDFERSQPRDAGSRSSPPPAQ